jgi:hypothetical protein
MHAVAAASQWACGDDQSGDPYDVAVATAKVFAKAVAGAFVYCKAMGDTKFYAKATAEATATLETWLTAYAEAFASAGVCGVCDSYAESFGYVQKYVCLEAVAMAEAEVCYKLVTSPSHVCKAFTSLLAHCACQGGNIYILEAIFCGRSVPA